MKSTIWKILKLIIPLALGVYLIWYFFSTMDENGKKYFYEAIGKANYWWVGLSMLLSFLTFASRAYRWKYMLEPIGYQTKFWNRYHSLMIGYIINLTIPRAGEASRSAMLYRSEGVPFSKSFGTIIAERAVDFCMLLIVAGITALLGMDDFKTIFQEIKNEFGGTPENNQKIGYFIYYGIAIAVIILSFLFWKKPKLRTKLIQFIKDIIEGLFSIFKSKNPTGYILHTLFIWASYITYFGLCFLALDETKNFPISGILLGFIAGSLGIIFTNGGIGTFPLLVGLVVNFILKDTYSNALSIGNALGMIMWVSQTVLLITLGLLSFLFLPKNFEKENVKS
jgi:uncharacterized membrane protein YbhN (UPF0104 family)